MEGPLENYVERCSCANEEGGTRAVGEMRAECLGVVPSHLGSFQF